MVVAQNPRVRNKIRNDRSPHWTELPEGTTRVCTKCGTEYPLTPEFFVREGRRGLGLTPQCRPCTREYHKRYQTDHYIRKRKARRFGITEAEYDKILDEQNGVCAICGDPSSPNGTKPDGTQRSFAIDHDHETGKVRGLLCTRCNPMLGFAQDNREILLKAAEYLLEHQGA